MLPSRRHPARILLAPWCVLTLAALIAACRAEEDVTGPTILSEGPSLAISDAAHAGKSHFYFLPPMVPAPAFSGVFDATLSPEVKVCRLAGSTCAADIADFTASTSPAVTLDAIGEAYKVVWQTKNAGLKTTETYRIQALVGSALFGFADLKVAPSSKKLTTLGSDVVGLVQDKTLQIKFRIERNAVGTIRVTPGSDEIEVREDRQYQVLYFDLHGAQVSGSGPVQWVSSDPSVLSIDEVGKATGRSLGRAQVGARTEGLEAAANATVYRKIAFVSNRDGNDEIYLVRSTGAGLQRLTTNLETDTDPSWSPDGSKLAFVRAIAGGARVFVMNADGSGAVQLSTSGSLVQDQRPRWSPDGQRIAFRRESSSAEAGLYVIGANGGGQARVSGAFDWFSPELSHQYPVSWSPAGDQVVVVRDAHLQVVNADGTGEVQISSAYEWKRAEWSPSARILAEREGMLDEDVALTLMSLKPDGSDPITVTPASMQPLEILSFAWSPDATRVAYSDAVGEDGEISTIAASGDVSSNFVVGYEAGAERVVQEYSVDGKALVYTQRTDDAFRFQVGVIDADGSGKLLLAKSPDFDNAIPTWRP